MDIRRRPSSEAGDFSHLRFIGVFGIGVLGDSMVPETVIPEK
jgi:hypothetical protein